MIRYFITLSTIPSRAPFIYQTLLTLIHQSVPPTQIFLFVSAQYKRFPGVSIRPEVWNDPIYSHPLITVKWTEDRGPITKVYGILELEEIQSDDLVVYVDDDRLYDLQMVERYLEHKKQHPSNTVIGGSGEVLSHPTALGKPSEYAFQTHPGYVNVLDGCNGVLIEKHYLNPVLLQELMDDGCWLIDDECLCAMFAKQGLHCLAIGAQDNPRTRVNEMDALALQTGKESRVSQKEHAVERVRRLWGLSLWM
jgi:hypothetical protein